MKPALTPDSIIDTASQLGLTLVPRTAKYFDLEKMCACPAGIAAIMADAHLARASFSREEAVKAAGSAVVGGLCWGFDLSTLRAVHAGAEFQVYAEMGAEIRRRIDATGN